MSRNSMKDVGRTGVEDTVCLCPEHSSLTLFWMYVELQGKSDFCQLVLSPEF